MLNSPYTFPLPAPPSAPFASGNAYGWAPMTPRSAAPSWEGWSYGGGILPATQSLDAFSPGSAANRQRAVIVKEQGNAYRRAGQPRDAIRAYLQAIETDPAYTDAYFNLGQTYLSVGERAQAIDAFQRLLGVDPRDYDARVVMANQLMATGRQEDAQAQYEKTLAMAPTFDPAARQLAYLKLLKGASSQLDPPTAINDALRRMGFERLAKARALLTDYYVRNNQTAQLEALDRARFEFASTQQIHNVNNVAEYDHFAGRVIRFSPEMAFAQPNVLAAYLAHELTHAADDDALSSVCEEQDGYRELAGVWRDYKGATVDPNLDLALKYLNESPETLNQKVSALYLLRDPSLKATSPGHGQAVSKPASPAPVSIPSSAGRRAVLA